MSYQVRALVESRRLGCGAMAKAVAIQLAWAANDRGSDIYRSKSSIADTLETGRKTVIRAIAALTEAGVLVKTGTVRMSSGPVDSYALRLSAIKELPEVSPQGTPTCTRGEHLGGGDGVPEGNGTCSPEEHLGNGAPVPVGNATCTREEHPPVPVGNTINLKTINNKYLEIFERVVSAHPRPNRVEDSSDLFVEMCNDGADPEVILSAARAYAKERLGEDPTYTTGLHSWLSSGAWRKSAPAAEVSTSDLVAFYAPQIRNPPKFMIGKFNPDHAQACLDAGKVSVAELEAAGVDMRKIKIKAQARKGAA